MFNEDFKLHPDEHVILYVRRHWIFLLLDILQVTVYFFGVAIFFWVLQYLNLLPEFILFGVSFSALVNIILYMWAIFCWLLLAEKITDFAIDYWIVTNKRIVDSELLKLFHRSLATLELKDIEDISIETTGFLSSYLAYGSLKVQTAGARNEFDMQQIGHPEIVQRKIFEAKMASDREEKNIEKEEIEQISSRIVSNFHIPNDQVVKEKKIEETEKTDLGEYDWAKISERQEKDVRNIEENIEDIEEKYKNNIANALRSE